jgi:TM2 domain-containing membrane protein YozV
MARTRYRNQAQNEKSRIFAAIMAFFFGGFGVHKFYLRDPGAGILYIFIFFITTRIFPFSFILGWFDAFRLITMNQATFDQKYNKHVVQDDDYYERPKTRAERRTIRTVPANQRRNTETRQNPSRIIQKANPFKKSGLKKYKDFDLKGAIEDFIQGLKINPQDIALHFNLACAYSLTEKKEDAFYHLSKAVALGYNDFEKIQSHDDLAYLRIQPEFEEFKQNGYVQGGGSPEQKQEETAGPTQQPEIKDDVLLSQLNKLAELRKKGLLTEDEFILERKKLLRR